MVLRTAAVKRAQRSVSRRRPAARPGTLSSIVDWLLRRPGERPASHSSVAGVLLVPAVLFVCAYVYLARCGHAATVAGAVTGGLGLLASAALGLGCGTGARRHSSSKRE